MSTIRDPATITKVGRQMMTAGGDITYTKATLYGQDISHLTKDQLESLTSIGNPLVTVPLGISDKNDNGNGTTVILEATFQNSNLKADLPYTAVGFFAKRGDDAEKLIAVGVATEGAYLAAASPNGIATDALDIKVAIAIGDSANVTAMIDPAGSVTPAALHNAITDVKSEMKTGLDTKADKQTVTDNLATKADKTDVDAQIGTVNKSVSDLSDTVKANKDDADKTLATKADKATVESDLATKANQSDLDKTNSEVAKKADSEDVNAQLATKANSKDVNAALALKDDTADVDDKISNVAKSVSDLSATVTANKKATDSTLATKANASDVADSLATKADKTDVASDVKSLNDAINTKASQADLDKINAVVATKANATALADYARTVDVDADLDTKANKTDLESLAKTADVNSALDTKADKTTVDGDVKTLQASIDTKADKTALDDYAKSADVASDVKTLTDSIAAKADAKTVNDAISKIDFTPYAKSADVDSKLKGYTDTADLTKLLAGKADSDFSYSKAELDKKLLDLTTTTGGKVDASQVATMIENKADKSDVTKQIGTVTDLVNTKANSTDVTAALDKKDDTTDVDAKIKKVTDLANAAQSTADSKVKSSWAIDNSNGKFVAANVPAVGTATQSFTQAGLDLLNTLATQSQVADAKNTANQAISDYNKRPVIRGNDGDDLLAYKTNQLRLYVNVKNCKNLPPASNTQWFTVEYVFENPNGDGIAIFRSPASEVWLNGNNGGNYNNWLRLANAGDINNLQNAINTKANSSDVYTKSDVDYRTRGTIITDYDIASLTPTKEDNNYRYRWLVDQNVLPKFAKQINQLKGRRTVDSPDFNNLTDTGTYYITNNATKNIKNNPVGQWGVLIVSNGDGHRISQVYYPDDGNPPWYRSLNESTWHNWIQLSTKSDVQNAVNLANSASNKIDTVLANSYVRKQGMNANGDCIEIKHTGIKQANGGYAFDMWSDDWTASKLNDVIKNQLPSKANTTDVNNALNGKANAGDVSALQNKVNVNTPLFREISADSTWEDIFGVTNPTNVLTSLRINPGGNGQLVNDYAAGIGFGGNDTKAVISVDYGSHVARFTAGNGTSPGWSEDVAWKSDISNLQNIINQQNQTIQSLTSRLNNAENEIRYIKANYVEGRTFPASQEAQANSWENANPQRIAFIEK